MSLSCSCDYDLEPGDRYFEPEDDFTPIPETRRRKRCFSCRSKIDPQTPVIKLPHFKCVETDIEEKIYGDVVPLADKFLCEECGEIYLNLSSLGYECLFNNTMQENIREYWEETGFDPEKYRES